MLSKLLSNFAKQKYLRYAKTTIKLLTDIGLQPGTDALFFYYRGLYIFSNTNFPIKETKQTRKITIALIFSTVSIVISPPMQEAKLPVLTNFQFVSKLLMKTPSSTLIKIECSIDNSSNSD